MSKLISKLAKVNPKKYEKPILYAIPGINSNISKLATIVLKWAYKSGPM